MTQLLDRLATLSTEKRELLVRRLDPLSFTQERLWFLYQLAPGVALYNVPLPLALAGPLDVRALGDSLRAIERRHEILRTTFPGIDGRPVQYVAPESHGGTATVDLEAVVPPRRDMLSRRVLDREARRPFDVERGPLWRRVLVRLGPDRHMLMLTWHHLVFDGWSRGVFMSDLALEYRRRCAGDTTPRAPLPTQYRQFARYQRERARDGAIERQLAYWRTKLGGELPIATLPTDRATPAHATRRGADESFALPADVTARLQAIGRHEGVTLFMALLAGWVLLLYKYGAGRDLIVGTANSGRSRPEFEQLIGCFINTLALRLRVNSGDSVRQLLAQAREVALGAYANQDVPFERVVDEIQADRRADETPLFRTLLTLENTPGMAAGDGDRGELAVEEVGVDDRTAKFDLACTVKELPEGVVGALRYATDLFDRRTVRRLSLHLRHVLEAMAASPDTALSALSLLTSAEHEEVLATGIGPVRGRIVDESVVVAFDRQVPRHADAIAVSWRDTFMTYAAVDQRAVQLAAYLQAHGVGPDAVVAVCLRRSPELVVALVAVLKAGGAYLPIDPSFPPNRVAVMFEEVRPILVLSESTMTASLPVTDVPTLVLDRDWPVVSRHQNQCRAQRVDPQQAAYVIFTSGSTGRPKGVVVPHGALANFLVAMEEELGTPAGGSWMSTTSAAFDISILELLWTLTRGMQVVVHTGELVSVATPVRRPIAFGLFYFASDSIASSGRQRYELLLEGARRADEYGFSSVWMPERHFHRFGGIYPNPSITAAAVAAVTRRVPIRAGSVVLPLHDPIRVAEEWAVVDNLSNGRVGISFASGWHANDFVLAPERYATRREAMRETIDVIRRLWRGEAVSRHGPSGQPVSVKIFPSPVQPELPIWLTSGGNPETFRQAGALGANLLTHLLGQTVEELADKIRLYREAWHTNGHGPADGRVTLMLHTYVGDDREEVRRVVRGPFSAYLRDSVGLLSDFARSMGGAAAVEALAPADVDALVGHAFERYFQTSGLFGTPESALEMVHRLQDIGIDEIGCLIDFGVEPALVLQGLTRLARLQALVRAETAADRRDPAVAEQLVERGITHLQCTPTWAQVAMTDAAAPAAFSRLATLLVGGEALPPELAAALIQTGVAVRNMYGPTETTIWSSTDRVRDSAAVTIGTPITNTSIYVCDGDGQLLPHGLSGEIWIGGSGVARGYWRRPQLTAERFTPDPFGGPGARVYRTGDRGRWGEDGRLEFLGRNDQQIKLRGRRIELSEIEAELRRLAGIREAVVLKREDVPGEPRLVAYVVWGSDHGIAVNELQQQLRDRLPAYMVPQVIMALDRLPTTTSGKVDRRRLPRPDESRVADETYVAPRTAAEIALAQVWSQVLRRERVGIHDNFFALGGDSILSLHVVARVARAGWRLLARHVFEHQTLAALAQVAERAATSSIVEPTVVGDVPLLPMQAWFFELERPALHHYNQQVLLEVAPEASAWVSRAWQAVLAQHDALRFRFGRTASGWRQTGTDATTAAIPQVDLAGLPASVGERCWRRLTTTVHASLNLERGPIARAALIVAPDRVTHLLVVAHHLVVDGVSWRIILEDFQHTCREIAARQVPALPPKSTSVRQLAAALRSPEMLSAIGEELEFWSAMSAPATTLRRQSSAAADVVGAALTEVVTLTRDETAALVQDLPGRGIAHVQELLLAAVIDALAGWSGSPAWRIDLEGHGRDLRAELDADVSRTVGWLTALYPVRLEAGSDPIATLRGVKSTLRRVPHGGVGYGVLRYLDGRETSAAVRRAPRAEIIFNYLGQFDQVLQSEGKFRPTARFSGRPRDPRQPREYALEINGLVRGGHLHLAWTGGPDLTRAALVELAERFVEATRTLVRHATSAGDNRPWLVPADFPLADIGDDELQDLGRIGRVLDVYPLAPMQQGMLFDALYGLERSSLYAMQYHHEVHDALHVAHFRAAWQQVLRREPMLRTAFLWKRSGTPLQVVFDIDDVPCTIEDLRSLPSSERDAALQELIAAEQGRGFDIERPPLMRLALVQTDETVWHIVWTAHHLILDGWSVPHLMAEVAGRYGAALAGAPAEYPPAMPFRDYVAWVRRQDARKAESYWREALREFRTPTLLVPDAAGAARATTHRQSITAVFPDRVPEQIRALASAHAVTPNTWLMGAWALLMAHYTQRDDVLFGEIVSGRPAHLTGIERALGVFITTLPVRVGVSGEQQALAWLHRLQQRQIEARDFEYLPLANIQFWSELGAGTALFDTLFVYENYPVVADEQASAARHGAGGLTVGVIPTPYPLVLQVQPGSTRLGAQLVFDPGRVPDDVARDLVDAYLAVVDRLVASPESTLDTLLAALSEAAAARRERARRRTRDRGRDRLRQVQVRA